MTLSMDFKVFLPKCDLRGTKLSVFIISDSFIPKSPRCNYSNAETPKFKYTKLYRSSVMAPSMSTHLWLSSRCGTVNVHQGAFQSVDFHDFFCST